jgi:hypothetical protein
MKYIIGLIIVLLLVGCKPEEPPLAPDDMLPEPDVIEVIEEEPEVSDIPSPAEIADICDSLCRIDADKYCKKKRSILVNNIEVIGTCRAFARQGNVEGFNKCQGFCKTYDQSLVNCETPGGDVDYDCDGVI